jgi:hypothetical protein
VEAWAEDGHEGILSPKDQSLKLKKINTFDKNSATARTSEIALLPLEGDPPLMSVGKEPEMAELNCGRTWLF